MTPCNMISQILRNLRQMHWVQNYRRKWTALLMSSSRAAEPFCKGSAFAPSAFSWWIMGRFKGTVCRHFLNRISRKGGGRPGLRVSLWHWASLLTSLAKLILIRLCITCYWLVDSLWIRKSQALKVDWKPKGSLPGKQSFIFSFTRTFLFLHVF